MIEKPPRDPKRRSFLKWLPRVFLSLWGVGFAGVVVSYLRIPQAARSAGSDFIRAGSAETLAAGSARLIRQGRNPLYILRLGNGEIIALSALCTHYRCVLNWDAEARVLVCPCHNGVFNAGGEVISGPPQKDLPAFRTEVRLGEILVHVPRA